MEIDPRFIIERDGRKFVLYAGVLNAAHEEGLKEISTEIIQLPSNVNGLIAIMKAVVITKKGRFSAFGDADPTNTNERVQSALLRVAETRAKARALRDAVNVGIAVLEELPPNEVTETKVSQPTDQQGKEGGYHITELSSLPSHAAPPQMITTRQIGAINSLATKDISGAKAQEMFGHGIEDMTRAEASKLIQALQA